LLWHDRSLVRKGGGLGLLYVAIATRAFRRYSTYRSATLAGIFTNSVFGIIYSFAYLALWEAKPGAGGYDSGDAVTYVWLGQALLMTIALWGGGTTDDLAGRIRTGDIAIDLYRPVGLVLWYLASDLGRAVYHLLARGLAPTLVGALLFDINLPASPAAALGFALAVPLAVIVSFGIRFLVASSAFWLLDQSGVKVMSGAFAIFFSGMMLPLVLFPGWLGAIARALPWAAYVQVPADIWLGKHAGGDLAVALGFQVMWAVILLSCCQLVVRAATRKVVVQGG
jgi:ABC-2 type transport system permease protein